MLCDYSMKFSRVKDNIPVTMKGEQMTVGWWTQVKQDLMAKVIDHKIQVRQAASGHQRIGPTYYQKRILTISDLPQQCPFSDIPLGISKLECDMGTFYEECISELECLLDKFHEETLAEQLLCPSELSQIQRVVENPDVITAENENSNVSTAEDEN